MNVLFLSTENPYPVDGGHHLRTYYILKILSRRYDIHFIGFAQDKTEFRYTSNIKPFCKSVDLFRVAKTGFNIWFILLAVLNCFSRAPLIAQRYYVKAARRRIRQILAQHRIDLVHVDMLALGLYKQDLGNTPAILTNHNVESLRLYRWMQRETHLPRLFLGFQYHKLKNFERKTCRAFDHCIAVSETDKTYLENLCQRSHFSVVPNGVDTDTFHPLSVPIQRNRLLWVGGMSGPHNSDAVAFFFDQIWPLLIDQRPNVEIDVVGGSPTARLLVQASKDSRIHVHGFVDDVRPFVARAAVFVAPLRSGSGTKLKVLNTMSQARPVVATSIAAEGIEVLAGIDLMIADEPETFGQAVLYLLNHPNIADKMGQSARNVILKTYDWRVLADPMYNLYDRIAGQQSTALKFRTVLTGI
jgi:glycosyltransferase involved in cell wall biosynthesis